MIKRLWSATLGDKFFGSRLTVLQAGKHRARAWGTGDGLYFVQWEFDENDYPLIYDAAKRLINVMKDAQAELRVALHQGPSVELSVATKRKEVTGTGLNEAARIVSYAAGGQVLLTEQFLGDWHPSMNRRASLPSLHPAVDADPFTIYVKHGVKMQVRVDSEKASGRLQFQSFLRQGIEAEIKALVEPGHSPLGPEILEAKPRVSIFQATQDDPQSNQYLKSTIFRHCARNLESNHLLAGNTTYAIQPEPIGLGIAFQAGQPDVLHGLPDPSADLGAYAREVAERWKVPERQVTTWRRKARAFFAIPMSLHRNDPDPAGVVCFDFDGPLDTFSKEDLLVEADKAFERIMRRLVLLWKCKE